MEELERFERVSVKAIIRDPKEPRWWLLIKKKRKSSFTLPGGGVEEGETYLEALERELHEEICLDVPFSAREVYRLRYSATTTSMQYLWVVFEVSIPGCFTAKEGDGVKQLGYMNPRYLTGTQDPTERRVFECYREIKRSAQ